MAATVLRTGDAPPAPAFPATAAAAAPLPLPLTPFIGRATAVAEVRALLGTSRLLTVTGAGGSGKTRLALEVAAAVRAAAGDVAWVELAPIATPELVAQQVATAVGLCEESGCPAVEALHSFLRARGLLLVLDNCEHLVDACAALADGLLRASPGLRILATSREPLGVPGERAWLIPPLSLPADGGEGIDSEAVQLFVERARDALPGFALTPANRAAVAQICHRLDGMPLAIELAAARVRVLPAEQLAERLDDAFRVLGAGSRAALPRHRTLRAVMDWSYALLTAGERTLLGRLSVFDGGFTLDAVEDVCAAAPLDAGHILDLLAALVDRSLVVMQESAGLARYRMLETVKQYAAERLREAGEEEETRRRHAAYFVALVTTAEPHLTTFARRAWIEPLQRDADNIRQTLAWTREHARADHVRLAGMLLWFWFSTRDWVEGRRWLDAALALPEAAAPTRERAAVLFANGALATLQARSDLSVPWLEESAAIAAALGDDRLEAYVLNYLGMAHIQLGKAEGEAPVEKALAWFRDANDLYGLRLSYLLLSTLAFSRGQLEHAHELTTEAVRIARLFDVRRELGVALQMHAGVALLMGDVPRAARTARESLAALRRDPMFLFIARGLDLLGTIELMRGNAREAVILCGAANATRVTIGAQPFVLDRQRTADVLGRARTALGDAAFDAAWAEGAALDGDAAVARALAMADGEQAADGTTADAPGAAADGGATTRGGAAATSGAAQAPANAGMILRVSTLGGLEIDCDGVAVAWPYARPRELFVYLLCHPEGRTREQIGVVFWPESSAAQVKNNFHVTMHHLRRSVGRGDCVLLHGERYRINPELNVWLDVTHFEAGITEALRRVRRGETPVDALSEAVALYRGDFLAGTGAGDWHLDVHDRMQRLAVDGLAALGRMLAEREAWQEAAQAYERLLRMDELNEAAHRGVMRCLARSGERTRALRHYERVVKLLRDELDTTPERETERLAQAIRDGGA
jgi:predicted ATPase/DNA-binding SARP family transcriptional activator